MQFKNHIMKITVIGAGNIGGATAKGLSKVHSVTVTARTAETLARYAGTGVGTSLDNNEAVAGADIIILAVKPWQIEAVAKDLAPHIADGQIVVSMAPGVAPADLLGYLGCRLPLAYAIPNTAIEQGESMTFVAGVTADEKQVALVAEAFEAGGPVKVVPMSLLLAGTSLASCGIAYAFRYIDAAARQGAQMGFTYEEATEIVAQTVKGAASLLLSRGDSPAVETARVTTPGGLTLRGLDAMEKAGFSEAVAAGLAAIKK